MSELDLGPYRSWIELEPEQQEQLLNCPNDELVGLMAQLRLTAQAMSWVADCRTFIGLDDPNPQFNLGLDLE